MGGWGGASGAGGRGKADMGGLGSHKEGGGLGGVRATKGGWGGTLGGWGLGKRGSGVGKGAWGGEDQGGLQDSIQNKRISVSPTRDTPRPGGLGGWTGWGPVE